MSRWVFTGLKTGIVTTPYPRREDRTPGVSPGRPRQEAAQAAETLTSLCPTGALRSNKGRIAVDRGRCVHCSACRDEIPWEATVEWASRASDSGGEKVDRPFRRSLHVFVVDTGDCGACLSEVRLLNNPCYNMHRLGFFLTPTPRKADLLLLLGPMTAHMRLASEKARVAMPTPKHVMAVGTCAVSGGLFGPSFAAGRGAADLGAVDVFVPGCPPPPLAILHGLLLLAGRVPEAIQE